MRAGLSFLAVEDHEFQRGVLRRILLGLGATHVALAADGGEALRLLKAADGKIDIVISDLDMPGMDGLELVRHLGEAGIPVAIIVVSALGGLLLSLVQTMAEYGANILGVIEKPVTPAKLQALIAVHMATLPGQPSPQSAARRDFTLARMGAILKKTLDQCLRLARPAAMVDRSVLASVCAGNAVLEREILTDFRRMNEADAALLESALSKRDAAEITASCDRIRNASGTIGAKALGVVCGRLERASCAGDWAAVKAHTRAFQRELARLNRYCEEAACTPG